MSEGKEDGCDLVVMDEDEGAEEARGDGRDYVY